MVPVQKWWQIPYFWGGCKAYDLLAGSEGIESSYFLTKSKAIDAFPMLKRDDVIGAMVYYGTFLLFFFFVSNSLGCVGSNLVGKLTRSNASPGL